MRPFLVISEPPTASFPAVAPRDRSRLGNRQAGYATAKAAADGLMRSIALEYGRSE
jgi:NAD(P)-dependent dehydrogenase (short-subunit alcohol dehydrogenase family)